MPNYKETERTTTNWQRCCKIVIDNPLDQQPSVRFEEESIIDPGEGQVIKRPLDGISLPFDPAKTFACATHAPESRSPAQPAPTATPTCCSIPPTWRQSSSATRHPSPPSIRVTMALTISVPDTLRKSVEAASQGKTPCSTRQNQPCYMVVIPKFTVQSIDASLGTGTHRPSSWAA